MAGIANRCSRCLWPTMTHNITASRSFDETNPASLLAET
ncbi:hypothetical protein RHRU231_540022 [Rhodococcus ruber]|uniref:Uncharacterized protein n=1 Tax=Rhodococcus ruber TaxID=1830 RepID=A0A098BN80_9NOCA|nr:hypothetical protein RHRU231_540022 [Rhodococcus ruber]